MLARIALALLRSPILLVYSVLCVLLGGIGFVGAYLMFTIGFETLLNPSLVWAIAGFGVLWGVFWLYLLAVVLRDAAKGAE